MKKAIKYSLIIFAAMLSISFNACNKVEDISSGITQLPFDFTYYGVIPVGSSIKEIRDTIGINYRHFYFNRDGKLNKITYQFKGSLIVAPPPAFRDTTITLDIITYNSNNQLVSIGNTSRNDVYSFEYIKNELSKVTDNSAQLLDNSTTDFLENTFISDNSGRFISSVYQLAGNCPINKTYHYTQNKLDSISATNSPSCPLISTSSLHFFYTNDLITGIKVLTNLAHFDPDVALIYSNDKLIEIKQPNALAQGVPHTVLTYY
ncbi:MAG: hypothetical protein U0T69_12055 [Chitinophagales bacterium]